MGLDITAYRNLSRIDSSALDAKGYPTDEVMEDHFYISPSMVEWSNNFGQGQATGLTEGLYDYDESSGFRAGSYSGYNEWRRWLANVAGYESPKG